MSGAFGWIRNDRTNHDDDARSVAQPQTPPAQRVLMQAAAATPPPLVPPALVSTAPNVLIAVLDATGSMKEWPQEIFRRLPRLHADAERYLGGDAEILFIVMGDAKSDARPIQAVRFGRGPELDGILASFDLSICGGGGNGCESHELVAAYVLERVNLASARNAHLFFITDEPPFPSVNPDECRRHLGFTPSSEFRRTDAVFVALRRRMNVHGILCATGTYDPAPIEARWKELLGEEGVLRLDDHRRVVDVMLGTLAAVTGQVDRFTQDLRSRQLGTAHGVSNVRSVLASIALVGHGTPSAPHLLPKGMTVPLLPDNSSDD